MEKDKLFNKKLANLKDKRSAYKFIKDNFRSIEMLPDKGYSKKEILNIINEEGFEIKYHTFRTYYLRIKKELCSTKTDSNSQANISTKEKPDKSGEKPKTIEEKKDYDISKLSEDEQKVAHFIYEGVPYTKEGKPCAGGIIGAYSLKSVYASKKNTIKV